MSFIQVFRILWARRNYILVGMAVCLGAALIAAAVLPKRYDATSRVMLDTIKPDPVTGQTISSQSVKAFALTQTQLIRDYRVAGRAVDKLGLASSPELAGQYADRSSSNTQDFRRWLAQIVIDHTEVVLIQGSNILEIKYSAGSAEAARRGADALLEAYIDQTIAFKREDALADREWFAGQLGKLRQRLTEAQARKAAFEREHNIVLTEGNVDSDEQRLKALAQSPEPLYAGNPAAYQTTANNTELARLDAEIANASQTLGPNHPTLIGLREQRREMAKAAEASKNATISSLSSVPSISSQISAQTQKVLAQRGKVSEAQRISAEVDSLRSAYQEALNKTDELKQLEDSSDSSLTPLGKSVAPESPAFPDYKLLIGGGLALGGLLGLLSAILAELLNRRVRGIEDLAGLGVPVIGSMSRVEGGAPIFLLGIPLGRSAGIGRKRLEYGR